MVERNVREERRRRRQRQKRRAWSVVTALLLCSILAVFLIGFLSGCLWQRNIKQAKAWEHTDRNVDMTSAAWENMVYYNGHEDAVEYGELQDENRSDAVEAEIRTEVPDQDWNLLLVNQWNKIPDDYVMSLVDVGNGERVDERIYEPLMKMLEDAKEANWGMLPRVVSGYRTAEKQQQLYDEKAEAYRREGYADGEAEELASQWVMLPGYSEHQLGLAVDINGATYDVYLWLQQNSYKYGFIFRYPGSKTELTGVSEEVWHYRYVGVEAATEIYEQGICLEEYVERMEQAE